MCSPQEEGPRRLWKQEAILFALSLAAVGHGYHNGLSSCVCVCVTASRPAPVCVPIGEAEQHMAGQRSRSCMFMFPYLSSWRLVVGRSWTKTDQGGNIPGPCIPSSIKVLEAAGVLPGAEQEVLKHRSCQTFLG